VALGLRCAFRKFARLALHAIGALRLLFGNRTGAGRHPDIGLARPDGGLALRLGLETILVATAAARLVAKTVVAPCVEPGTGVLTAIRRLLVSLGRSLAPGARGIGAAFLLGLLLRIVGCVVEQRRI